MLMSQGSKTSKRRRNRSSETPLWKLAGLGGVLVLVVVLVVVALSSRQGAASTYVKPTDAPSTVATDAPVAEPAAAFLGDSYTEGLGADSPSTSFPQLVAAAAGWTATIDGETGSGYLVEGIAADSEVYAVRAAALPADSQFVVISGGINDAETRRDDPDAFTDAVRSTLSAAGAAAPDAKLIVLAPFWPYGALDNNIQQMRDAVRDEAASAGATFIDPIAEGWQADTTGLLLEDGLHPNQAGYQQIADRLVASLTSSGIIAG